MDLIGKVVIITGASSGIGRALALLVAQQGAVVVGVARREAELASLMVLCVKTSPDSFYLAGDLSQQAFAQSVIDRVVDRCGRLDILVNNAGAPLHKPIYQVSPEEAAQLMQLNFMSALWMSLRAIPTLLLQEGGMIVNISSFASIVTPTYESIYAASKSAMNGFSRGLWADLQGSGIHVLLVHPGPIATEIWSKFEQPGGYQGYLYPAEQAAREILRGIHQRRFEIVVPKRSLKLILARWLAFFMPSIIRKGVQRMDPVPGETVEAARGQAGRDRPA